MQTAAKLYQMRDSARTLLGGQYAGQMADIRKIIEAVMAKRRCNELSAALELCKAADDVGGFGVIVIMAAAVEMIEPSADG